MVGEAIKKDGTRGCAAAGQLHRQHDDEERAEMPADRTLLAGTGRESTRQTILASRRAAEAGADAVLVRAPFFFRGQMTADALTTFFTAVADASPVPVVLYNMPGVTGFALTPPIVRTLAAHPNVIGLKETSVELERLGQFVAQAPGGFTVLCGQAPVIFPALMSGAGGGILAAACVVPEVCTAIHRAVREGRHADALRLQQALTPLGQLVTSGHGVPGLKAAMDLAGYRGGAPRGPLLPVADAARAAIGAAWTTLTAVPLS
jgi:4-hydroxy-2-oxoglutarate aldolase